jgi:hypothetical protein
MGGPGGERVRERSRGQAGDLSLKDAARAGKQNAISAVDRITALRR